MLTSVSWVFFSVINDLFSNLVDTQLFVLTLEKSFIMELFTRDAKEIYGPRSKHKEVKFLKITLKTFIYFDEGIIFKIILIFYEQFLWKKSYVSIRGAITFYENGKFTYCPAKYFIDVKFGAPIQFVELSATFNTQKEWKMINALKSKLY